MLSYINKFYCIRFFNYIELKMLLDYYAFIFIRDVFASIQFLNLID